MRSIFYAVAYLTSTSFTALAADLSVRVSNIQSDKGRIGCSLHSTGDSFPMEQAALQIWQPAIKGSVECIFMDIAPGNYAIAVSHDVNENGITDTNFLGIPKESWGVSNNVRPVMRAPTFEEAKFQFPDINRIEININ